MPLEWCVCGIFAKNIVNNHINIVMKNRVLKRVVFGVLFVAMAFNAAAQQIIVTKSKEQIKAKIIEISDTQIKYRIYGSTDDTPVLTMTASEIKSVLFEDGYVYTFDTLAQQDIKQQYEQSDAVEIPNLTDTVQEEYQLKLSTGKTLVFRTGVPIETRKGKYFYGKEELRSKDYADFMRQLCPDSYSAYRRSKTCDFFCDAAMFASGFFWGWSIGDVFEAMNHFGEEDEFGHDKGDEIMLKKFLPHFGIGLGICLFIGVPLYNKAIKLNTKSINYFNQNCAFKPTKPQSEISVNLTTNGAGISFRF